MHPTLQCVIRHETNIELHQVYPRNHNIRQITKGNNEHTMLTQTQVPPVK